MHSIANWNYLRINYYSYRSVFIYAFVFSSQLYFVYSSYLLICFMRHVIYGLTYGLYSSTLLAILFVLYKLRLLFLLLILPQIFRIENDHCQLLASFLDFDFWSFIRKNFFNLRIIPCSNQSCFRTAEKAIKCCSCEDCNNECLGKVDEGKRCMENKREGGEENDESRKLLWNHKHQKICRKQLFFLEHKEKKGRLIAGERDKDLKTSRMLQEFRKKIFQAVISRISDKNSAFAIDDRINRSPI